MAALAGNLEGDIVGSVALDFDSPGREVVEVLVQQLEAIVSLAPSGEQGEVCPASSPKGSDGVSYVVGRLGDICEARNGHCGVRGDGLGMGREGLDLRGCAR